MPLPVANFCEAISPCTDNKKFDLNNYRGFEKR